MNYIKRLKEENQIYQEQQKQVREDIEEVISYLHSRKFSCGDALDGYVNVVDIISRMQSMRSKVIFG